MIKKEYAEAIKTMTEMCRDLTQDRDCIKGNCPFYNTNRGCFFAHHIPIEYSNVIKEEVNVSYEINEESMKW